MGVTDPKTIDWANIGFGFIQTKSFIKYTWNEASGWDNGQLLTDPTITLHIGGYHLLS